MFKNNYYTIGAMATVSRFANKSILITGGSKGIGLGLVKRFLACPGSKVVATTRKPAEAQELKPLMRDFPERLQVLFVGDVHLHGYSIQA